MSQNCEKMAVREDSVLDSSTTSYYLEKFVGSGSFGRVATGFDLIGGRDVALKVLKDKNRRIDQREIEMLRTLQVLDPIKTNVVQFFEVFEHKGFTCLVFEKLDHSLHHFMADRKWDPLLFSEIRPIAQQLLTAFNALKSMRVIHADLKLDNIMLVNHHDQPFKIKLIDFGVSMKTSEAKDGMHIQVEAYRAPEVFLGLPLSEAVDMWSLGCVLFKLYTACHLFGRGSRYEVMNNIVKIIGQPADHLLGAGRYTNRFFRKTKHSPTSEWRLKTQKEYHRDSGTWPLCPPAVVDSLTDLMEVAPEMDDLIPIPDRKAFVGLLKGLLTTDAQTRMDPGEALRHPFISMIHLKEQGTSNYALDSFKKMDFTKREEPDQPTEDSIHRETCDEVEAAADEGAPVGEEPGPGSCDPPAGTPEAAVVKGAPAGEEPGLGSCDPTESLPEATAVEGAPAGEGPGPGSHDPTVSSTETAVADTENQALAVSVATKDPQETSAQGSNIPTLAVEEHELNSKDPTEGLPSDPLEAAADADEDAPAEINLNQDCNDPPGELALTKERRSRWRRIKKFFSRALRRAFRLRGSSQ